MVGKGFIKWLGSLPTLTTGKHFPHLTLPSVCHSASWLQPHTVNTFLSEFSTGTPFPLEIKLSVSTQKGTKAYISASATFGTSLQQKPYIAACCLAETGLAWSASLAGML